MKEKIRTFRVAALSTVVACLGVIVPVVVNSESNVSQQQTTEKRVEETFKNIKVLRGLPASQMFSVMNFMRASLGVNQKNHDLFSNGPITCFTCHRGNTKPVSSPSLPVPAPEGGASGLKPEVKTSLPTAAELIDRYVRAVGDRNAMARLNSREMSGTLVAWDGAEAPLKVRLQLPDKIKVTIGSGSQQRIQAFDGNAGWIQVSNQTRPLAPGEMSRLRATQNPLSFCL